MHDLQISLLASNHERRPALFRVLSVDIGARSNEALETRNRVLQPLRVAPAHGRPKRGIEGLARYFTEILFNQVGNPVTVPFERLLLQFLKHTVDLSGSQLLALAARSNVVVFGHCFLRVLGADKTEIIEVAVEFVYDLLVLRADWLTGAFGLLFVLL